MNNLHEALECEDELFAEILEKFATSHHKKSRKGPANKIIQAMDLSIKDGDKSLKDLLKSIE